MNGKPKIIVTGANGQVGKELQDICGQYSSFEFIFLAKDDLPIHQFDLARNIFLTVKPQYCINCAAYTAVDKAEDEKELARQVNGEAVGVLAAICWEYRTRFLHLSTDYIFDGTATIPYTESFPPNPINAYGESKLEGENQAMQLNPESIIIRTSWLYSSYGKNFVKTMMKLMRDKNEISVVNDQIGSPTYAGDLAVAIMNIIGKLPSPVISAHRDAVSPGENIFHFTNDGVVSWYEFALAIKEITGSACIVHPISSADYPTRASRPAFSVMDKTRIVETFGIKLQDWKKSLETCIRKIQAVAV